MFDERDMTEKYNRLQLEICSDYKFTEFERALEMLVNYQEDSIIPVPETFRNIANIIDKAFQMTKNSFNHLRKNEVPLIERLLKSETLNKHKIFPDPIVRQSLKDLIKGLSWIADSKLSNDSQLVRALVYAYLRKMTIGLKPYNDDRVSSLAEEIWDFSSIDLSIVRDLFVFASDKLANADVPSIIEKFIRITVALDLIGKSDNSNLFIKNLLGGLVEVCDNDHTCVRYRDMMIVTTSIHLPEHPMGDLKNLHLTFSVILSNFADYMIKHFDSIEVVDLSLDEFELIVKEVVNEHIW